MNLYYKWAFCVPPSLPQTQQNKGVKRRNNGTEIYTELLLHG